MNHKRKRSHRQVRCTMCTKYSWLGNHKERLPLKQRVSRREGQREIKAYG